MAERSRTPKHPDRKNPAEMAVGIVFVRSSADAKAARKARRTYTEKIRQGLLAIQASVAKGCRNTDQNSVARRVAKVMGKKSAAKYFRSRAPCESTRSSCTSKNGSRHSSPRLLSRSVRTAPGVQRPCRGR